jgi:hypothetical protein
MKSIFACVQFHHWSYSEIENMIPWERDIYLHMLETHVKEENARIERETKKNG